MPDVGLQGGARQRNTKQRSLIEAALAGADGFLSAQELHDRLRRSGESVGLTTVYRALQSLADAGTVDVVRTEGGEALYRRCASGEHHHHLLCRTCGRSVELAADEVEQWASGVARQHGFTAVEHLIELVGTCRGCTRRQRAAL